VRAQLRGCQASVRKVGDVSGRICQGSVRKAHRCRQQKVSKSSGARQAQSPHSARDARCDGGGRPLRLATDARGPRPGRSSVAHQSGRDPALPSRAPAATSGGNRHPGPPTALLNHATNTGRRAAAPPWRVGGALPSGTPSRIGARGEPHTQGVHSQYAPPDRPFHPPGRGWQFPRLTRTGVRLENGEPRAAAGDGEKGGARSTEHCLE
jgi:hypothetical protein